MLIRLCHILRFVLVGRDRNMFHYQVWNLEVNPDKCVELSGLGEETKPLLY